MVAIAIPAGDAVDDSVLVLLGAPALASALVTALLAARRGRRRAPAVAGWALGSAIAAVVLFGVVFWAAVAVDCATRDAGDPSCS